MVREKRGRPGSGSAAISGMGSAIEAKRVASLASRGDHFHEANLTIDILFFLFQNENDFVLNK
jgi:hypothetical protein